MTYVVCYLEKDDKKLDFGKRARRVEARDTCFVVKDANNEILAIIPCVNVSYFWVCRDDGIQIQHCTIPAEKLTGKEVFSSITTFAKTEMVNALI